MITASNLTAQQREISRFVLDEKGNLLVVARAGTGKSTTIVHIATTLPKTAKILYTSFNTRVINEMLARQERGELPRNIDILTIHSFGNRCLTKHFGFRPLDVKKTTKLIEKHMSRVFFTERIALEKAVEFAKFMLASTEEDVVKMLRYMVQECQIETVWARIEVFAEKVVELIELSKTTTQFIDFSDMFFLPVALDLAVETYDHVFIDETQDFNVAQLALAAKARRDPGGRIYVVGDDRQSIYGWRGADPEALNHIRESLHPTVLPLSTCFRCATTIVDLARETVPDIRAAEGAPQGVVSARGLYAIGEARVGDVILSRTNAPLLKICVDLIAAGIPSVIAGKEDINRELGAFVSRSKCKNVVDFLNWLERWGDTEIAKLKQTEFSDEEVEQGAAVIRDRVAMMSDLMSGCSSLEEAKAHVGDIFVDANGDKLKADPSSVICSTVHRAKGLEWGRVFLLEATFRKGKSLEEDNIWYVAVTRAKRELIRIQGELPRARR